METGQLIYIICRLVLGAFASSFAIILFRRTQDAAWMLVVAAVIAYYAETVYVTIKHNDAFAGLEPFMSIILSCLPVILVIAALVMKLLRTSRR